MLILNAKIKGGSAGNFVAMVTFCLTGRYTKDGQFFDTMIVASTDKKSWKVLETVLSDVTRGQAFAP